VTTQPDTDAPPTENDVKWWLRKLFDHIDTDAIIQREKMLARDPMNPAREMVGVTLTTWEKFLRPRIAEALNEIHRPSHTQDCINAFYGDFGQSGCRCDAPQEGRPRRFAALMESDALMDDRFAQEGRPTTPQTEAALPALDEHGLPTGAERRRAAYTVTLLPIALRRDFIREVGRQIGYEVIPKREAAAGALPSVERLAEALATIWPQEPGMEGMVNSTHRSQAVQIRDALAAAPPEASER
jgi:hypothetical protein